MLMIVKKISCAWEVGFLSLSFSSPSKGQSYSWGGNISSPSQEIPLIVRNPKVHYCIHKFLPPVHILSQINPAHACLPQFSNTHLLLSSLLHLGLVSGLQSSGSPTKPVSFTQVSQPNPCWTSPVSHTCHMSHPSHSSRFDHPNNTWWKIQTIKLLIM